MSVTPCDARPLADDQNLHDFLQTCQEKCQASNQRLIVSITQAIFAVEPLTILQQFTTDQERVFYWENQQQNSAISAWGSCIEKKIISGDRFQQTEDFINEYRDSILETGDTSLPEVGAKFLTNLTFFDSASLSSLFPSVTIFIPKWQITRSHQSCFLTYNCFLSPTVNIIEIKETIKKQVQKIETFSQSSIRFYFPQISSFTNQLEKAALNKRHPFEKAVKLALEDIQQQKLTKIVLSHHLDVVASLPFDPFLSLNYLRQKYPDCYIFLVGDGQGNNFIGATPERLFSLRKQTLISDALAGSAARGKNSIEDEKLAQTLLSSEKERREHNAVSSYIIQQLKQLGLTPEASRRQLLKLNNIQHLWTVIKAEVPTEINPIEIVAKLHPTPAVAGVPTEIACEKIREYETFDRAFYAAPIGWLDGKGNAEFMVGIRSAMIQKNQARLYAGAGIVAGSNPKKELAEIQLKLQAMLKALRS